MSEEVQDEWAQVDITLIASGGRWLDLVDRVLYENKTPFTIRIGLGHTVRQIVHVVIGEATKEDEQRLKSKMLEGKVLSDE